MIKLQLKIPPVIVMLLFSIAMWLAAQALPQLTRIHAARLYLAGAILIGALGVVFAGVAAFRRARTTVDPTRPEAATSIVRTGVYRISRNPMYVGFLLMLVALAVWLSNAVAMAGPILFLMYMNTFQIRPEEQALRAKFGTAYDDYVNSVRRWL
jgi:protein-S-isoprenylcysteine O-methyltransferase Ste14